MKKKRACNVLKKAEDNEQFSKKKKKEISTPLWQQSKKKVFSGYESDATTEVQFQSTSLTCVKIEKPLTGGVI